MSTQKSKFASMYKDEDEDDNDADDDVAEYDNEEDDEAGYGLRQNPRKTWRIPRAKDVVDHHQQEKRKQEQQQQKFICSKCGKGFQSSKALCGHMACHSEKEKAPSNVVPKQKQQVMDSQSDTESGAKNPRRTSRRRRYKKHNSAASADGDDSSKTEKVEAFHHHQQQHQHNNCSSGASGVEQQQEEVAICLMMLSRDYSGNRGGLNSIGDSSDNNSVVLEARSISTKLAKKSDADKGVKECGSKKVRTFDNSQPGCVRNGAGNVEADVKVKNLRKRKLEEGSKAEPPHLSLKKLKTVMDGGLRRESSSRQIERPSDRAVNESNGAGYSVGNQYSSAEMCRRFDHKAVINAQSHAGSPCESGEISLETDASPDKREGKKILEHDSVDGGWKKGGEHEFFRSGQAQGGHRRVHLAEGDEKIKCDEVAANFKPIGTRPHDFIDLNLPAPTEDEEEASESMASYGQFQARHQA
uniref:C2H2-type domain-containing protein n=1 Tax=Kalanchoe fedtschenkoi TaxID=63787 RepID=A0A7N0TRY4_KALFE